MKGLISYHFSTYFRTYRYIPPFSVFIMMLVINYTYVPNPILNSYAYTSIMLFFIMGWFTITIFHAEDQGQKNITIMHLKNKKTYYIALEIVCLLISVVLSILAVLYPIAFNAFSPGLNKAHIAMGFLAHFSLAILSIALSSFFTRDLVRSHANTWWGVSSVLIGTLVIAVAKIEILQFISWITPPLRYCLEMMSIDDNQIKVFPIQAYGKFGWIILYSLFLLSIFIASAQKKRVQ